MCSFIQDQVRIPYNQYLYVVEALMTITPFQIAGHAWSMKMSFLQDVLGPIFSIDAISHRLLALRWGEIDITVDIGYCDYLRTWAKYSAYLLIVTRRLVLSNQDWSISSVQQAGLPA